MDLRFFERTSAIELNDIRKVIRELIRLIDKSQKVIVHTNFEDELKEIRFDESLPSLGDLKDYKEHISEYVKHHQDHIAIQKLKRNKPITLTDIESFADMLEHEQSGTKEQTRYHSLNKERPVLQVAPNSPDGGILRASEYGAEAQNGVHSYLSIVE